MMPQSSTPDFNIPFAQKHKQLLTKLSLSLSKIIVFYRELYLIEKPL